MTAITYRHDGLQPFRITVKIDGKIAGSIRRGAAGYYYRTKAGNEGERFATVEAVKASLEGEA